MVTRGKAENPINPGPELSVDFGPGTDDEMNIGWTEYANATPIDDILAHDFGTRGTGVEDLEEDPEFFESELVDDSND